MAHTTVHPSIPWKEPSPLQPPSANEIAHGSSRPLLAPFKGLLLASGFSALFWALLAFILWRLH